eukprot:SAG31_NODE_3980_length_3700_cov_1.781727_2_plen_313_part_00
MPFPSSSANIPCCTTVAVKAAQRLGFKLEGTRRYIGEYKGEREEKIARSTTHLSILAYEWPAVRATLCTWLHRSNFDFEVSNSGRQRLSLSMMTKRLRNLAPEDVAVAGVWPLVHEPKPVFGAGGSPLGSELKGWDLPPLPPYQPLLGRYCRLEPVSAEVHAADLHAALTEDTLGLSWTYTGPAIGGGQAVTLSQVERWLTDATIPASRFVYTILVPANVEGLNKTGNNTTWKAVGTLEQRPGEGFASIGHVVHAPPLRGTAAGTEAHWLAVGQLFKLGHKRVGWGCDSHNAGVCNSYPLHFTLSPTFMDVD